MFALFKSHAPRAAKRPAAQPAPGATPAPKTAEDLTRAEEQARSQRSGSAATPAPAKSAATPELGGPEGPEPTRYGDWERKGICYDF